MRAGVAGHQGTYIPDHHAFLFRLVSRGVVDNLPIRINAIPANVGHIDVAVLD